LSPDRKNSRRFLDAFRQNAGIDDAKQRKRKSAKTPIKNGWALSVIALKALCDGLILQRIGASPSTDFDMFGVGAPTHSSADDWIGSEFVSNADRDMFMADRRNAQFQLQHGLYLYYSVGIPRNFEMAAYYFKLAADEGLAEGQYNYGFCLQRGEGVERNFEKASYYFKLAADQGDARGQCNYGFCLQRGEGVERNFEMAAYYFKLAADQGNADGQYNYGFCLQRGEGVERNFEKAAYYFKLAADQGHADGQSDSVFVSREVRALNEI
jgi:TPR repeat protein